MGDSMGGGGPGGSSGGGGGGGPSAARQETRGDPALQVPGFQQLSWLLPKHTELTEISFMLLQLLLGQPVRAPPQHTLVSGTEGQDGGGGAEGRRWGEFV